MAKTPGGRQVSFRQSQIGDSAAMGIVKVASASRTAPTCWICSGVSSDTGSPRRTPSLGPNVQRRGHSPERWWTSVLGGAASTNRHWRIKHLQRPGRARFLGQGIAVLLGVAAVRANGLPPRRYVKCWTDQAQYSVSAQILPECVRNMVPLPTPRWCHKDGPRGPSPGRCRGSRHRRACAKSRDGRNHSGGHAYRTIVTQASRGPPVHAHPSTGSRDRRTGT